MERDRIPGVDEARRKSEPVLTNEFADKAREHVGNLPDETRLGDLRIPPRKLPESQYVARRFLPDCNPPEGWRKFYLGLKPAAREQLSAALGQAMDQERFTVRDIRETPLKELLNPGLDRRSGYIGPIRAAFLKRIFEPPSQLFDLKDYRP